MTTADYYTDARASFSPSSAGMADLLARILSGRDSSGHQFFVESGGALNVRTRAYGALGDGKADDTKAIQRALADASSSRNLVVLPAGTYVVTSQLVLPRGVRIVGAGARSTTIKPASYFSGDSIVSIDDDGSGASDLQIAYASSTSANNPVASGIKVTSGRYASLYHLDFSGINGYPIEVLAGADMPLGAIIDSIHTLHCAGGIHIQGNNVGSNNFGMQTWLSNINVEINDSLDGIFIEDANDVLMSNINGAASQGSNTNSTIHIKGKCSTVYGDNLDVGVYPGPGSAPTVLIEAGSNGSPSDVNLRGTFQAGAPNIKITDGSRISVEGTTKNASTHGVVITNLSGPCFLDKLTFSGNNQAGGSSTYDLQLSNSTNFVYCRNSNFASAVNATPTAASVIRPIDDQNHRGIFLQSNFDGTGTTPSTVFQGTPQIVRGCRGYNPRGSITAPDLTGTFGQAKTASQDDVQVVFTSIGGMTGMKLGGSAVSFLPVVGAPIRIPARGQYEIDGAGTLPTWIWIAD